MPEPTIQIALNIIKEIESALIVCDKMEGTISDSMRQADALRRSILERDFEGKLTT
jgi:type I restriction enzyme S subunit